MKFEERTLTPHAEPITAQELEEGAIYFSVNYVDEALLIPTMETLVFIGRNLEPGDRGQVYFQDIDSYLRGVRYKAASKDDAARFSAGSEKEVSHIFQYERALEELMRCSVQRRKSVL